MTIELIDVEAPANSAPFYYISGFCRTVPGVKSFVFPVMSRSDADLRLLLSKTEKGFELLPLTEVQEVVPVYPVRLCEVSEIDKHLPIFGFEIEDSCCFGSATGLVRYFSSRANRISGASLRAMERLLTFIHSPENTATNEAFFAVSAVSRGVVSPREMYGGTMVKVLGIGAVGRNVLEILRNRELPMRLLKWDTHQGSPSHFQPNLSQALVEKVSPPLNSPLN